MAIDIEYEMLLSLPTTRHLEIWPGQHQPGVRTIWRWALEGLRGVRLETVVIGNRRLTSPKAIERFIVATTRAADEARLAAAEAREREAHEEEIEATAEAVA